MTDVCGFFSSTECRVFARKILGCGDRLHSLDFPCVHDCVDIREASEITNPFRKIRQLRNRPQVVMAVLIPFFPQLRGINAIMFYVHAAIKHHRVRPTRVALRCQRGCRQRGRNRSGRHRGRQRGRRALMSTSRTVLGLWRCSSTRPSSASSLRYNSLARAITKEGSGILDPVSRVGNPI